MVVADAEFPALDLQAQLDSARRETAGLRDKFEQLR